MAIGLQLLVQLGDARGEGFADETLSGLDGGPTQWARLSDSRSMSLVQAR